MRRTTALLVCLILGLATGCGAVNKTLETVIPPSTTTIPPSTTTSTTPPTTTTTTQLEVTGPVPVAFFPEPPAPPAPLPEPTPVATPTETHEPPAPSTDIETLICATFTNDCSKAIAVAWCESNHNPNVVGGAGERGLFQIHPVHIPNLAPYGGWDAMFNPTSNIAYAHALYSNSGWGPWTCA
jgi:hypothetical protein